MFGSWELKYEVEKSCISFFSACHGCVQTHIAMGCIVLQGKRSGLEFRYSGKVSRSSLFIALKYGEIALAKSPWEQFCMTVEQKMAQNVLKFWKNNGAFCWYDGTEKPFVGTSLL